MTLKESVFFCVCLYSVQYPGTHIVVYKFCIILLMQYGQWTFFTDVS